VHRKRRSSFLTLQEREEISRGLASELSMRAISADKRALDNALRPKENKLNKMRELAQLIEVK